MTRIHSRRWPTRLFGGLIVVVTITVLAVPAPALGQPTSTEPVDLPTEFTVITAKNPAEALDKLGCRPGDQECLPIVTSESGVLAPKTLEDAVELATDPPKEDSTDDIANMRSEAEPRSEDVVQAAATPWYNKSLSDTLTYSAVNPSTGQVVVVGKLDVAWRLNLNGWLATFTTESDAFSGPAVKATHHYTCREANGILPNSHCIEIGNYQHKVDSVYRTNLFKNVDTTYHGQHEDVFYWEVRWTWQATGWSGWTWVSSNGYIKTPQYECRAAWTQKCRGK